MDRMDREVLESKLSTFEDESWGLFASARAAGHDVLLYTHPGVGLLVADLTAEEKNSSAYLDEYAEECWPGEGPWPTNDGEYPAWVLAAGETVAECVAGSRGDRLLRDALDAAAAPSETRRAAASGEIFFDSWGNPWESVPASHPNAEAFGPRGSARRALGVPCLRDTPKNALEESPEGWVFLRNTCPDGGFCAHQSGREDCEGIWPDRDCPHRVGGES